MSARTAPDRLAANRKRAGLVCAKKLDAAVVALRAYLSACNECRDGSESLSLQGKGVDGREIMIRDLSEYSCYLDGIYGSNA